MSRRHPPANVVGRLLHQPLFVDASAWVALLDPLDRCHAAAAPFWRSCLDSRRSFVTSDYVVDESFTHLRRRRNGLEMARALHDLLEESRLVEVAEVGAEIREGAWQFLVAHADKVLSFTDCTSFMLMRDRRLFEAFTFDGDFLRAGFVAWPG